MSIEVVFEITVSLFAVFGFYCVLAECRKLLFKGEKSGKNSQRKESILCRNSEDLLRYLSDRDIREYADKKTVVFVVMDKSTSAVEQEKIQDICIQQGFICANRIV